MIILISGNSCTGKTLMAQNLLEKYKITYLSIDHLKMGLYRSKYDCGFTPLDRDELIGKKLWPILRGIILTNIENNQNIIIEGCYLLPELVKKLKNKYPEHIIAVFFGFSTKYIKNNFHSSIIKYRSVIETRGLEERPISQFIKEHNQFREKCIKNDVDYFEIDNDYEQEILEVFDFIDKKMKNKDSTMN